MKAVFIPEGIERQELKYENQRYHVENHARFRSDPAPEIDLFKTHSMTRTDFRSSRWVAVAFLYFGGVILPALSSLLAAGSLPR